jgi:dUTP pyrophosphatase
MFTEGLILKYKKHHPNARIDYPAREGDIGYDLYSIEDVFIPHGEKREVPIGISFEIPYGYYATVETRSSHGVVKGLRMHRSIIDAGFRGIFTVVVYNHDCKLHTQQQDFKNPYSEVGYQCNKGEKIGQLILHKGYFPRLVEVDELAPSERGTANWGSTDKK